MRRVLVIGRPGSGKSIFAQRLADISGLPLIHLDAHYHDKRANYYTDKPAWRAKVNQLTKGDRWIIDGNYSSTMPDRFIRADTIFFFDFGIFSSLFGVVQRRWHFRNERRTDMPPDWIERADLGFLRHVITFNHSYRPKTLGLIDKYPSKKVIIFKNRADAEKYLKTGVK